MYTQLSTKLPGDTGVQGMIQECAAMKGRSYGSAGEFCAVPGSWTQLSSKVEGGTSYYGMIQECDAMKGRSYGSAGEFCAIENKIPSMKQDHAKQYHYLIIAVVGGVGGVLFILLLILILMSHGIRRRIQGT